MKVKIIILIVGIAFSYACSNSENEAKILMKVSESLDNAYEAEDKGVQLDEETFAYLLNTPVVETNARDGVGIDALLKAIVEKVRYSA